MSRPNEKEATFKKVAIGIAVGALALFTGMFIGSLNNITVNGGEPMSIAEALGLGAPGVQVQSSVTPPSSEVQAPPASDTTAPTQGVVDDTTAPAGDSTTAPAATGLSASSSVEEIVAYFNTSANKIKTDATKVVRNYEDLHSDPEYLQVPSAVTSIADFAMNKFLKKNETPVEYATKDDIIANYPVKTQAWVSQITADQLASATCEDDGTNYNITLNFKDDNENISPTFGVGYGKAFNLMLEEEVALDYPGLSISNIRITYHNGVIKCKIDKATGNMISSNYDMPMILALTAKILFSEVDAQIGMTFAHDYTISY